MLKKIKKADGEDDALLQDYLLYIDVIDSNLFDQNYPKSWKYVSLFPATDTEESKKQREENLKKIKALVETRKLRR